MIFINLKADFCQLPQENTSDILSNPSNPLILAGKLSPFPFGRPEESSSTFPLPQKFLIITDCDDDNHLMKLQSISCVASYYDKRIHLIVLRGLLIRDILG